MRSSLGATLAALFLTGGSASSTGCSPCRVGGQEEVVFTEGITNESRTLYQTGEVDAEMLHFPQGRTYDLMHGLGSTPVDLTIFVSFRSKLTASGDKDSKTKPNNVAESAGNQAVIEVWNDEIVRVRNDTCAEFYMRAVIVADPDLAAIASIGGAAGAPGE
jgi:hypothetical protein